MKTTVKLDTSRAIEVKDAGKKVMMNGTQFGLIGISIQLTPDQAAVLGQALQQCAQLAEAA